jgi:hypothetical protein
MGLESISKNAKSRNKFFSFPFKKKKKLFLVFKTLREAFKNESEQKIELKLATILTKILQKRSPIIKKKYNIEKKIMETRSYLHFR